MKREGSSTGPKEEAASKDSMERSASTWAANCSIVHRKGSWSASVFASGGAEVELYCGVSSYEVRLVELTQDGRNHRYFLGLLLSTVTAFLSFLPAWIEARSEFRSASGGGAPAATAAAAAAAGDG